MKKAIEKLLDITKECQGVHNYYVGELQKNNHITAYVHKLVKKQDENMLLHQSCLNAIVILEAVESVKSKPNINC